jgi:hypothetical protein
MAYSPISAVPLQYSKTDGTPANGYYLKFYVANSSTPISMQTDSGGATSLAKCKLNEAGYPISNPNDENTVFIPHLNTTYTAYRFVLYASAADADANNVTSGLPNLQSVEINAATTAADDLRADLAANSGSSLVGFLQAGTGAVARTVQSKMRDKISVLDFIPDEWHADIASGTLETDLTTYFESAIATGKRVYAPKGRYRVNVQIGSKTILEGDGSQSTILQPFDESVAIMTYTYTAQQTPIPGFWDYHSEVHGIGFWGRTSRVGVGFTFGKTVPSNYQANDELANNVKFFGCRFYDLEKGVQFPFGNIGTEFHSCGFSSNKYGVYTLNNKFGNGMHSGNKYFYGGEIGANECGLYVNDVQQGGAAAGIEFFGTIFEFNNVAAYIYTVSRPFLQCMFDGVWFESNGALSSGGPQVSLDVWVGSTVSTQSIDKHTIIMDGDGGRVLMRNSFCTDIEVKATNAQVTAIDCHVEKEAGNNGAPCIIADTSVLRIKDSYTGYGNPTGDNITVTGFVDLQESAIVGGPSAAAGGRWYPTISRGAKIADYGPSKAITLPLKTAYTLGGGAFTLLGTVEADGRIYNQCNQFSRAAFLSTEYVRFDSNVITTTVGWYVFTMDVKVLAGNPVFYVWDRSTAQLATNMTCPEQFKWFTFAGYGYSGGGDTLYFDVQGSNSTCTWRNSALQLLRFDTKEEAQSFLVSGAFAES